MELEQKALALIQKQKLFAQGDNVIVACSGGADSMALFHFLYAQQQALGIQLSVAHFEHGLRGAASVADAEFVRSVCEKRGVKLYMEEGNMAAQPKPQGLGIEAWARQLRYQFFDRLARENSAKIALAHTLSDNAETVLFRMARGSGPKGLGGIAPVRQCYVRPLLAVSRGEVEHYCREHQLAYVTDATNSDERYSRNCIRSRALPALEQAHPGAAASIARLAEDMRALDDWLEQQAVALLASARRDNPYNVEVYSKMLLQQAAPPLRLKALSLLAGRDADRKLLAQMEEVLAGLSRAAQLPQGRKMTAQKDTVAVADLPAEDTRFLYALECREGHFALPGGYTVNVEITENQNSYENCEKKRQKSLTFAADYDKMINCGILRTRRANDTFTPAKRGVTKTLKKWMNEEGIPEPVRNTLPLLAFGSEVLWVWGEGFCLRLQPTGATKRWLVIRCGHTQEENMG